MVYLICENIARGADLVTIRGRRMTGMDEPFRDELLRDERVLWVGQPDPQVIFTRADLFLIPFSLMWGGFAIIWEATALLTMAGSGLGNVFFALWGIPFVIIGLYFIVGRFFYKRIRKARTYYAVTNRRILILSTLFGRNLQAANIDTLPSINKSIGSDGTGTIRFGNSSPMASWYANTGMEAFGGFYGTDAPTFHDIPQANSVYQLVSDLRNRARSAAPPDDRSSSHGRPDSSGGC